MTKEQFIRKTARIMKRLSEGKEVIIHKPRIFFTETYKETLQKLKDIGL